MTNSRANQVTDFLSEHLRKTGRNPVAIARAIPGLKARDVLQIFRGEQRLPVEHVADFAQALQADALALLQHCLSEYAPATYLEAHERLGNSLTADELDVVDAMRDFAHADFIAGQTAEQRQKMRDWLVSLRSPTSSVH